MDSRNLSIYDRSNSHVHMHPTYWRNLAILQSDASAGCEPCAVLLNAFRSFFGDWILEKPAETVFSRVLNGPRISVQFYEGNAEWLVGYEGFEIVSEQPETSTVSLFSLMLLIMRSIHFPLIFRNNIILTRSFPRTILMATS